MLELLSWAGALAGLAGTALVLWGGRRPGLWLWLASNSLLVVANTWAATWPQVMLFSAYLGLTVAALLKERKHERYHGN